MQWTNDTTTLLGRFYGVHGSLFAHPCKHILFLPLSKEC